MFYSASLASSFLSTGVEHAYFLLYLCPVVDYESQLKLFSWLRNLLGFSPLSEIAHASLTFHRDNYRTTSLLVFKKLVRTCTSKQEFAFFSILSDFAVLTVGRDQNSGSSTQT